MNDPQLKSRLAAVEAELREVKSLAQVGSWSVDLERDRLFWDEQMYQIHDLPSETSITQAKFLQAVHPEDQQRVALSMLDALRRSVSEYNMDYRVVDQSGAVRFLEARVRIDWTEDVENPVIHGVTQDVSRFRSNEEEYQRMVAIVHHSGDTVIQTNMQGEIIYMNPAGMRLFGFDSLSAVTETPIDRLLDEMAWQANGKDIRERAIATGNSRSVTTVRQEDDTPLVVEQTTFPIFDATGHVVALAITLRDISQQQQALAEREQLQAEIIATQQQVLQELSTPIIPLMDGIIVLPLIGAIDSERSRDITRSLLAGITEYRARTVILDITGVPLVDTGVADHLNKTVQAARLKGARTIVTGISDAVAETVVDLGIDWTQVDTLRDLQTGLRAALIGQGYRLVQVSANGKNGASPQ